MNNTLLVITQGAGILLLVASFILLFFRRIQIDGEGKETMKLNVPGLGEMTTQSPVVALILIAAVMVVYPITRGGPQNVDLKGHIETGGKHVSAIVVAVPYYEIGQDASGDFSFKIPLLSAEATYRVKFLVDKEVIDDQQATLKDGRIELNAVKYQPAPPSPVEAAIVPKKEVSDADLQAFAVPN